MNNTEFNTILASKLSLSTREVARLSNDLVEVMTEQLENECILGIYGFGSFEVKKKLERIITNPLTKQRMLVPPKLAISFKPNTSLKGKAK